jgi:hypothetical protein
MLYLNGEFESGFSVKKCGQAIRAISSSLPGKYAPGLLCTNKDLIETSTTTTSMPASTLTMTHCGLCGPDMFRTAADMASTSINGTTIYVRFPGFAWVRTCLTCAIRVSSSFTVEHQVIVSGLAGARPRSCVGPGRFLFSFGTGPSSNTTLVIALYFGLRHGQRPSSDGRTWVAGGEVVRVAARQKRPRARARRRL